MKKILLFTSIILLAFSVEVYAQPTNLQENNITTTSVDLSWVDASCGNAFQLRYRLSSSTSWNSPITVFVGADTSLVGLTANTPYDWKVKCSGGAWSSVESFTTLDAVATPTISTAFISQPILCNGDYSTNEIHVDISQTSPPSSYACVVGYYPFPGYFIKYIGTIQTTANSLSFISFNADLDYFVRLVDSTVYFSANPFGNGFSTAGIFDEFGPITFTEPAELLATTTTVAANMCFDDCIATEDLNISGGIEPYSFTFDGGTPINLPTGTNNYTFTNLCSGQFQIIITDANSCIRSLSLIIDAPDILSTTYVSTGPTCFGGSDGSAEVFIIGGTPNYTINAFGNSFVIPLTFFDTPNALSAGVYPFFITDANGCEIYDTIQITESAIITSIDTQVACDSYTWIDNVNYTSSNNTATYTLVSSTGCDSIITLNLTINYSTTTNINITNCESYLWYGQLITQSGTYTTTLNTLNGCDSVLFLDANIINCGCTDPIAFNYDSTAILDDGSCIAILSGCTDALACNYDILANSDDGSCAFPVTVLNEINSCDSVLYNGVYYSQSFSDTIVFYGANGIVVDTSNSMSYCASNPLPELNNSNATTIDEVTLVGDNFSINNNTSGYDDFYDDFTYLFADIQENQSYTINITVGDLSGGSYNGGAKVFIDYNIDGDFLDAGEEIGIIPVQSVSGTSVALSFTVPNTGIYGATRIRVVCWSVNDFTATGTANDITPCESPASGSWLHPWFGATEDYSVVLLAPNIYSSLCDSLIVSNIIVDVCGCTDINATNYNATATSDDGTCTYCQYAIIDSISTSIAGIGDTLIIYGNNLCVPAQINLQGWVIPSSNILSSTSDSVVWIVPPVSFTFTGVNLGFFDTSGTASYTNILALNSAIAGCMDVTANNYDPFANVDDGSCCYMNINQSDTTICFGDSILLDAITNTSVINTNSTYRYLKFKILNSNVSGHAPRTTELNLFSNQQIIPYIPIQLNGSLYASASPNISTPYPFGYSTNCSDNGWILDVNSDIVLDLGSNYSIDSISLHHCYSGGSRSADVEITYSNDQNTWLEADTFLYLANTCAWYGYNLNTSSSMVDFTWSTGETISTINVNPSQTTTYWVTTIENGVSCTDSLTITVNQPTYSTTTIIECDSVVWNGTIYNSTGVYTWNGTNSLGCDSIATLDLTINQADTSYTNITTCDSIVWNGNTYTQSGTYSYSSSTSNNYSMKFDGIDDIITTINTNTNVSDYTIAFYFKTDFVQPSPGNNDQIFRYWLDSDIYEINIGGYISGTNYTGEVFASPAYSGASMSYSSGVMYNDDIWHYVVITKNSASNQLETYVDGVLSATFTESYNDGLLSFEIGGDYAHHYQGYLDDVQIYNAYLPNLSCITSVTQSGNYAPNLIGWWKFEEGPGSPLVTDVITGPGNSGMINGATYNTDIPSLSCLSGLTNSNGCDSTAVLNLTINQGDTSYTNITACDSLVWNGITYNSSGTYSYSGSANNNSMSFDGNDQ